MPGLLAFNRRWGVGSDDFVFPSFFETSLRAAWLIVIAVIFHIHQDAFSCEDGSLLRVFYIGTLVLLSLGIINSGLTMYTSMKGSIMNIYPRRHISLLLYIKLAILIPEVVWVIIGTYWAFGKSYNCDKPVVATIQGAVICAWFVGFMIIIGILVVFDPAGHKHSMTHSGDKSSSSYKAWETRCRLLCCCVACDQGNKDAFIDISKVVADFFRDVDLVPTDVASGLMLVQKQQQSSEHMLKVVITDGRTRAPTRDAQAAVPNAQPLSSAVVSVVQPPPWMTIRLMTHYMRFALASYGWPFFMFNNLSTGLCHLLVKFRCCACMRRSDNIIQDNCCQCNTAAIKQLTGISEEDLVFTSFQNKLYEKPFFIAIDRSNHAVVIGIRGTLSLEDALTDLSAAGTPLEVSGVTDSYVHSGMLNCANNIQRFLQDGHLLEHAFETLGEEGQLVITGHSLGAGVAAILAINLRLQYPNLICFAYSPPGGLMSPSLSSYAKDFICSVVVGKDFVPRLAMPSMMDLRNKILAALADSDLPKYHILASGCLRLLCGFTNKNTTDHQQYRSLHISRNSTSSYTEENPPPRGMNQETVSATTLSTKEENFWPIHMPGRILHIIASNESRSCLENPDYYAVWSSPENFIEILISPGMVQDHFPDVVLQALEQLDSKHYVPRAHQLTHLDSQDC